MRRIVILISSFAVALAAQTTGRIGGTLKDNSGAIVPDAIVTAYQQAKSTDGRFPPVFNAKTGSDGSFALDGVAPGVYVLCAEKADIGLLNPCFWSAKTTSVTVPVGGSAVGVSLVAEKGVALRIRLNDAQGLLARTPLLDDVVIGVRPTTGPALPGRLASKDAAGKTFIVLAPSAKPVDILIYSTKLSLSDDKGNSFSAPNFKATVTAPTVAASQAGQAAGIPDLTVNIRGQAPKP